jgi:Trypsin-co-occurring domain 1
MPTRLVRFHFAQGGFITIEEEVAEDEGALAARGLAEAGETFEAALSKLKPLTDAVIAELADLAASPEEWELELGIAMKGEAGLVLAKASGEANLRLRIKWKRSPPPEPESPPS